MFLFAPFSAFDDPEEVVNMDKAIAPRGHTMLICTGECVVTINKERWAFMRDL